MGWQIAAAVFQMLAAAGTGIMIWQAFNMLARAERQRLDSVAPFWDVPIRTRSITEATPECSIPYSFELPFRNGGFGPACDLRLAFIPDAGTPPVTASEVNDRVVVWPGDSILVRLSVQGEGLASGVLVLRCRSRLGEALVRRARIVMTGYTGRTVGYELAWVDS